MKICYIILHFKNMSVTENCLESIKKIMGKDSSIVVIDNGSGNGSGEALKEKYGEDSNCHVLLLDSNLGFSKGNNYGYQYAKEHINPDIMVVANNDVLFEQPDFEEKLTEIAKEHRYALIGPDILVTHNKEHQNPLFLKPTTAEEEKAEVEKYKYYQENPLKFVRRLKLHAFKGRLLSSSAIIRKLNRVVRGKEEIDFRREYENVGLQGACIIVTRHFFDNEEKLFDPEPFLYCEEMFLYHRCVKKGYSILYTPKLSVKHEESASFKSQSSNLEERMKFMLKHQVIAHDMLRQYLEDGK